MKAKEYAAKLKEKVAPDQPIEAKVNVLIEIMFDMHQEAIQIVKKLGCKTDSGLFPCLREVVQKLEAMLSQLETEYKFSELKQSAKELYLGMLSKMFPDIYADIERNL